MEKWELFKDFIKDDSVVHLTEGQSFKGSAEVAKLIIGCCEVYTDAYKVALFKKIAIGLTVATLAGVGIANAIDTLIKRRAKNREQEKKTSMK